MANLIASYTIRGQVPTHTQMDKHILALGQGFVLGRLLETTWYVAGPTTPEALHNYLQSKLGPKDTILVVEAVRAAWSNLPVDSGAFKTVFERQLHAA